MGRSRNERELALTHEAYELENRAKELRALVDRAYAELQGRPVNDGTAAGAA
jgi:hypothetical protein